MSSSTSNKSLPTFEILVDGKEISPAIEITSVSITEFPNGAGIAYISFVDGDQSDPPFPIANSDTFELGKQIEIKLGYDSVNQSCFQGEIGSQSIKVDPGSGQITTIICHSKESEKPTSTSSVYTVNFGENVTNFSLSRHQYASTDKIKENGQLTIFGTNKIKTGDLVTLNGFGPKFSGDLPAQNVSQSLENGAWYTTITLQCE